MGDVGAAGTRWSCVGRREDYTSREKAGKEEVWLRSYRVGEREAMREEEKEMCSANIILVKSYK